MENVAAGSREHFREFLCNFKFSFAARLTYKFTHVSSTLLNITHPAIFWKCDLHCTSVSEFSLDSFY